MTSRAERFSRQKTAINLCDMGCVGDGVADDTAAVQAAVDYVTGSVITRSLFVPSDKVFKLTAPITAARPLRITGEGNAPYKGMLDTGAGAARDTGSWFYIAHTGKGLTFSGALPISGVQLEGFGTFRDHPTIAGGWVPTDHDFDIYLRSAEARLDNLMLLNATRGISADQGNYGKFTASRIAGQFMKIGISLDKQYDVAMIDGFRAWNYWADNADVIAYTQANRDSLYLQRCDNPQIDNIFSISHRAGIRIGQSADVTGYLGGTTAKLKIGQADLDIGKYGLWIDSTVTVGAQVQCGNFSAQCNNIVGSNAVLVEGSNNAVDIANADLRLTDQNAIRNAGAGTGNIVRAGAVTVAGWNNSAGAFPAFEASAGNTIRLGMHPQTSGGGAGAVSGGAGTLVIP